ncbi:MAG: hypothetical protein Q8L84_08840 [Hyphomonas sp.]|nr:hypothetical protein [Hyphomonas sp.]
MTERPKRLAILHSRAAPRGTRHHMIVVIADRLREMGIEVVDLYGTDHFVPADAVFVHVDISVVPPSLQRFAQRYPIRINAGACDIRKRRFADGLLARGSDYPAPVIVKSDLNYGGAPEFHELSLRDRAVRRARRMLAGQPRPRIVSKADYRIFPTLDSVPADYFTGDNVVQKLLLEKDGTKNLLREYMFLGDLHYENIERSDETIITEDEHVSCLPFTPHPRLRALRLKLGLDYGKIDYVMIGGEPFIFDANKTIGLGAKSQTDQFGEGVNEMLQAFAASLFSLLNNSGAAAQPATAAPAAVPEPTEPSAQCPEAVRRAAIG